MKKSVSYLLLLSCIITACNSGANNEEIKDADSVNEAKREKNQGIVADEKSSAFLVRAIDGGTSEIELNSLAIEKSTKEDIKGFAQMLRNDHEAVNRQITQLAGARNVTLPSPVPAKNGDELKKIQEKTGSDFEKAYLDEIISRHLSSIELYENAVKEVKDSEVMSLADNTLPKLRQHLDSARALKKKYR